jgi:hypothetical protein
MMLTGSGRMSNAKASYQTALASLRVQTPDHVEKEPETLAQGTNLSP